MDGIAIGKAIAENGVPIITGIFLVLFTWLVRYFVTQQTEDRTYYRNLVTGDLKELHNDSVKNAELNNQTIVLQKDMRKQIEEHNGFTRKSGEKTLRALDQVCNRLNGKNPAIIKIKEELNELKKVVERRKMKKVIEVEKRK